MSMRRAIVDAARELLWERGFGAMSPAALLETSGAGQGSLYHHFRGKKDVALHALEEIETELTDAALELLADPSVAPLERIERWLTLPRKALKGCQLGGLISEKPILEDKDLRRPVARYFQRVRTALRECLEQAQGTGALRPELDADQLAAMLVATVQGGYVLSRANRRSKALDDSIRGALALLATAQSQAG